MSKQPDTERRTEIAKIVTGKLSPLGQLEAIDTLFTKAQLQLVDELMERKELLQYLNSEPRTGQVEAIPLSVLQQYKANLSGKGE